MGYFLRWLFAFLLLSATFNPTEWNFVRWANGNYLSDPSLTLFSGLILFIGYLIYLRATLRSIGGFGMLLVGALVASLIWVLYDRGIVTLENRQVNEWLGILALSLVLWIGLSCSLVRRMMTGQFDVDDDDED
jgi:hypothetical protein